MNTKKFYSKKKLLKNKKPKKKFNKRKRKPKVKGLKAKVGKIIGEGGFGCVIKPPVKILGNETKELVVSKILDNSSGEKELELLEEITKVDPKGLYSTNLLSHKDLTRELYEVQSLETKKDIDDCLKGKSKENKTIINMSYIGNSLDKHLDTSKVRIDTITDEQRDLIEEKKYITKNFKNLVADVFLGLDHFHKMGIIHRDIKLENITFGKHIDMDEGFSYLNSKGQDIYSRNNSNEFEFVGGKHCFKFIDFGLSVNFLDNKTDKLIQEYDKLSVIEPKTKEEKMSKKKSVRNLTKNIIFNKMIHDDKFKIRDIDRADTFIQKLYCGTLSFIPLEHYAIFIKLIRKFPDLLKKGTVVNVIIQKICKGKPYREDLLIEDLKVNMDYFGKCFSKEEKNEIKKYVMDLLEVENLEYYFFKSQVTADRNYKPLIFYQDYYCLGITLMTMYNYCGINIPKLKSLIKNLYHINIFERMEIDLEEYASIIRSI